jgi:hypothetical protein
MPTLKRKNANGQWEYIQVSGLDVSQLKDEVDSVATSLADKASQASLNTTNANVTANASYLTDYINPITYGAKFNGVDDDAPGLTEALKRGNVKIPSGKTVTIKSTVQISNSQRIIDGNECIVNIADNIVAFQVGTLAMSASLVNIVLQNMFVVPGNNSSFFLSYNSYFIKLYNIRINGLTGTGYGAKIWNGFNVTFQEFHISGKASTPAQSTISGNNAIGVHIYLSSVGVNPAVSGTINATNILFDSCLIQRVQYGVKYEVTDGVFDSNKMTNMGFSSCDYVFYETGGADNKFMNQEISTIRAEYCGTMFYNLGYLTVMNVYCYNTTYLIDNENASAVISFKGKVFHWNPSTNGCAVINTNLGLIDLSGVDDINYTSGTTPKSASGVYGSIIPSKATNKTKTNASTSLTINPFEIDIINQGTYLDFANISGYANGSEFYIMTTYSNVTLNLPDGTNYRFVDSPNSMLHCMVINGAIVIDGKTSIFANDSIGGGVYGISLQNKINFVTTTATIPYFNFNKMGMVVLTSTTNGVMLGNTSNSIINFADVLPNGATQIDLYNNVCILIPSGRSDGKGYVITMPGVKHSV